jgi:hypothetical protein
VKHVGILGLGILGDIRRARQSAESAGAGAEARRRALAEGLLREPTTPHGVADADMGAPP